MNEETTGGTSIAALRRRQQQLQEQQMQQQMQQEQQMQNENIPEMEDVNIQNNIQNNSKKRFPKIVKNGPGDVLKDSSSNNENNGNNNININKYKLAILVSVIFIVLNSKIIWSQIQQFPLMGSIEPSIFALVVNSIIAGLLFYFVVQFFNNC
jgi:hypothetical protein